MKIFLSGLAAGIILNIFILQHMGALELYPEFSIDISNTEKPEVRYGPGTSLAKFLVKKDAHAFQVDGNGNILKRIFLENDLAAFSGNGENFIKYRKLGTEIEYFSINGDKFWKLKSREYPYLSYNGRIILLANGDMSTVRIVDMNSNETGKKTVWGKLCTVIVFSMESDFSGFGFIDGSYHILDEKGNLITSGTAPQGSIVKSISISANGAYSAVHYGDSVNDMIRIINLENKKFTDARVREPQAAKMPLSVTGKGFVTIITSSEIVRYKNNGSIEYIIEIPPRKTGQSSIEFKEPFYTASYSLLSGGSKLIFFRERGTILLSREFPAEEYLHSSIVRDRLFVRGSGNLYCYSIHQ